MAYRVFYLSKTPYTGPPTPPYKRWNGSTEVNWNDTSVMNRYALVDTSPTSGWEVKQVVQDSAWSPFYLYSVGLWQWVSNPLTVDDIAGKLVTMSGAAIARARVQLSNKTSNFLQAHSYVRIVRSDGTTRIWLARGQMGGSYSKTTLRDAFGNYSWTSQVRVFDGDRICIEIGVLNANLSYIDAGRSIDIEIGAGSGGSALPRL